MKIFKHEGKGHYIGSVVVVHCDTIEEAEESVRDYLDCNGLRNESLNVSEWIDEDGFGIIHAQNGDY